VAADVLFANPDETVVVQIRDSTVAFYDLRPHSELHYFPPRSLMDGPLLTFVAIDVGLCAAPSAKEALAKALSSVSDLKQCVAIAVNKGRVCAFAQRFWGGALVGWRQAFQPMPEYDGSVAKPESAAFAVFKRSK
jgi:hypothetical protein